MGNAKLTKNKEVEVKDETGKITSYSADHIILATGGRAKQLPNLPIDGTHVIEYRKAMSLDSLPKKWL